MASTVCGWVARLPLLWCLGSYPLFWGFTFLLCEPLVAGFKGGTFLTCEFLSCWFPFSWACVPRVQVWPLRGFFPLNILKNYLTIWKCRWLTSFHPLHQMLLQFYHLGEKKIENISQSHSNRVCMFQKNGKSSGSTEGKSHKPYKIDW